MTLLPPVPLLTPTGQGSGWPAGGVTGLAAPNVVPLTQLFTVAAVTCAEEPPVTTVVVRICVTPLNVPVKVATSQPVVGLLSRSRRIWKVDVAAEAAGTKPAPRKRTANAILDTVDFKRFIGKAPRQNITDPYSDHGGADDGRTDQRLRTASMALPTLHFTTKHQPGCASRSFQEADETTTYRCCGQRDLYYGGTTLPQAD